jgi:hypothetical protein
MISYGLLCHQHDENQTDLSNKTLLKLNLIIFECKKVSLWLSFNTFVVWFICILVHVDIGGNELYDGISKYNSADGQFFQTRALTSDYSLGLKSWIWLTYIYENMSFQSLLKFNSTPRFRYGCWTFFSTFLLSI